MNKNDTWTRGIEHLRANHSASTETSDSVLSLNIVRDCDIALGLTNASAETVSAIRLRLAFRIGLAKTVEAGKARKGDLIVVRGVPVRVTSRRTKKGYGTGNADSKPVEIHFVAIDGRTLPAETRSTHVPGPLTSDRFYSGELIEIYEGEPCKHCTKNYMPISVSIPACSYPGFCCYGCASADAWQKGG